MNIKLATFAFILWIIFYWTVIFVPLPAGILKIMPYLPLSIQVMLTVGLFGILLRAALDPLNENNIQRLEVLVPILATSVEIAAVLLNPDDKIIYEHLAKKGKITQTGTGVKILWKGKGCYYSNAFWLNNRVYHPKIIQVIERDGSFF